jgi:hypothetical protein
MEIKTSLQDSSSGLGLPTLIVVDYDIKTDGNFYLLKSKFISYEVMGKNMNSLVHDDSDDSVLLDMKNKLAYSFSRKVYSDMVVRDLEPIIYAIKDSGLVRFKQNSNSISFVMDSAYSSFVTPFPQFRGNKYGVIEIRHNENKIELKQIRPIDYHFDGLLLFVKSFSKSDEVFTIPF